MENLLTKNLILEILPIAIFGISHDFANEAISVSIFNVKYCK